MLNEQRKRRPIFSIIINLDNDVDRLKKTFKSILDSKDEVKNVEFIIINNYSDDETKHQPIEYFLNRNTKLNIVFYQCKHRLTEGQMKNLGLDMSRGQWLYFINQNDELTKKFIKFLGTFKFNLQMDFYRIGFINEKEKKVKAGASRYFSLESSSFIFNSEFVERKSLRWNSHLEFYETLVMLNQVYSITNVNYIHLKKYFSVKHNFYGDYKDILGFNLEDILECFENLKIEKTRFSKQLIILMFNDFLNKIRKNENYKATLLEIKKKLKEAKIYYGSYLFLGWQNFFKTFSLRWKTMF